MRIFSPARESNSTRFDSKRRLKLAREGQLIADGILKPPISLVIVTIHLSSFGKKTYDGEWCEEEREQSD